ncbi:glyoxalase [Loktanella sp. TSTF-M6]|uniref:Glyoxalase n=2 Tax=Loktanella TaxID=245186 RepID=A0ABS8BWD4_9RHOB|nr:glyoxalase [Loktanella gaetbuli]MCB5200065.1 glyoxalase [Loktanella gaetbuli]
MRICAADGFAMTGFRISALHHVQLAMPEGAEDMARAFYAGRLGLTEVAKPAALAVRGGVWFAGGTLSLHLGVEDPFIPARKAHPALIVDDLEAAQAALGGSQITALPGLRRFYVDDPFGNRIEIVQPVA